MKHHDQKASWRGRGLLGLHFSISVHHWRKSGQDPGGRSWCRDQGGVFPLACSAHLLIKSRTTSPGIYSSTHNGLGHPPLCINWENALQLAGFHGSTSSTEASSFLMTIACVMLTHKTSQHIWWHCDFYLGLISRRFTVKWACYLNDNMWEGESTMDLSIFLLKINIGSCGIHPSHSGN